ncbi:hypothetical protein [Parafrankia sp. EUN1f]|uniref:hypothetical protein n=1 Tax=Parafrankia sp. EUN1f TaxID=102897 RepID=UPI0012FC3BB4|nr:hypothetical protein [Parafrankia sp. EUN1f]
MPNIGKADDTAMAECLNLRVTAFASNPEAGATGANFTGTEGGRSIDSTAEIVSKQQVKRDLKNLQNTRFVDCMIEMWDSGPDQPDEDGGIIEVASGKALSPPAGAAIRHQFLCHYAAPTYMVDYYYEILYFAEGQVEVTVEYTHPVNTPAEKDIRQIADQISEKLRSQQPRPIIGRPSVSSPEPSTAAPVGVSSHQADQTPAAAA